MTVDISDLALFLFVPADRPERFPKAAASGADAIIVDLEDAVAAAAKDAARAAMLAAERPASPAFIRINGVGAPWHDADVAAAAQWRPDGVVLPKAESAADIESLRARLPAGMTLIALIESARGLPAARDIAAVSDRLAFGSIDFAADLGCAHGRDALLLARSEIALAARLAGRPAPIDGVTIAIKDDALIEDDARYGAALGFGAKLLIHPAQVEPARRGFSPSDEEVLWAEKIVAQAGDGAARAVDGVMVDLPVLARAQKILRRRRATP